jgi:hypothetical protein
MADDTAKSSRAAGSILILTAIATVALILAHPNDRATDFAGVLKEEAAQQMQDAIVHAGFIVVLAIQLACYALLTDRLGRNRFLPTAAFTFFAVGTAALTASLVIDGLIVPALAVKYAAANTGTLAYVRGLFALCGTAIRFLMPLGLGFQAAGISVWGVGLFRVAHGTSVVASLLGLAMTVCVMPFVSPALVMAAVAGIAVWALLAGIFLFRQKEA